MKKVLALVLVAVLAIGMGMSGFASLGTNTVAKVDGFLNNYSLIDGYNYRTNTNQYTYNSNLHTVNLGLIYAQDKVVDYIDLKAKFFKGASNAASTSNYVDTVYYYLDTAFVSDTRNFHIAQTTPSSWDNMEKLLVQTLTTAYGVEVVEASTTRIVEYITSYDAQKLIDYYNINKATSWGSLSFAGANPNYTYRIVSVLRNQGDNIPWIADEKYADALARLTGWNMVRPADLNTGKYDRWFGFYSGYILESANTSLNNVLWFYTTTGAIWSGKPTNLSALVTDRNLSSEEIRENNITVATQIQEESAAVKEINFLRGEGRIEIKWVTRFVSVDEKDFLLTVYLNFNGRRDDDNALTFVGSVYNKELKIYAAANTADISEGLIAVPVEFNSKIALGVGNGATVHTKLFKDKKYYCTTSRDSDEADDIVFRQYPDVDNVLTFYPVGVNATGDYVTLSTDYDAYYVYDKDMNYLGRGNEQLQFSAKYYLANKRLDIDTDEEVDDGDYETPSEVSPNPSTGGDGQAANNVNSNPGTGR